MKGQGQVLDLPNSDWLSKKKLDIRGDVPARGGITPKTYQMGILIQQHQIGAVFHRIVPVLIGFAERISQAQLAGENRQNPRFHLGADEAGVERAHIGA